MQKGKIVDRIRKLFRRGKWTPLLPYESRIAVVILIPIEAILRGIDYVTGDKDTTTSSLTFVEKAMPLEYWGILFLLAGGLTGLGFAMKWPYVCILGLHISGVVYLSMTAGLVLKTWERGGDGFRTPVMFLIFALASWGMAIGYTIQMREDREKKEALGWK